jgi:hypothetical protein
MSGSIYCEGMLMVVLMIIDETINQAAEESG